MKNYDDDKNIGARSVKVINVEKHEFNHLIVSAFRYALGRKTYISLVTVEMIEKYWGDIGDQFKMQFKRDIKSAIEQNVAGDSCDVREWQKVLQLEGGEEQCGDL